MYLEKMLSWKSQKSSQKREKRSSIFSLDLDSRLSPHRWSKNPIFFRRQRTQPFFFYFFPSFWFSRIYISLFLFRYVLASLQKGVSVRLSVRLSVSIWNRGTHIFACPGFFFFCLPGLSTIRFFFGFYMRLWISIRGRVRRSVRRPFFRVKSHQMI